MRDNSGKGDSNTGLRDPTIKEREASKGRSGEAGRKGGHRRKSSPDNCGGGGR